MTMAIPKFALKILKTVENLKNCPIDIWISTITKSNLSQITKWSKITALKANKIYVNQQKHSQAVIQNF